MKKKVTVYLAEELVKMIKHKIAESGQTHSEYIEELIKKDQ